ncbi:hypothetical protein WALSEDRAFT_67500 [Wallemia mellicola CBS 633.66]|uniref:Uncharacterized protein n=1 Tax=Wallemia mellicola (strain ATCC MYA-4683 / CBS 633.66) TaxID=671144 RepID=I4YGV5_WALMC|nr:hypothetical protein WALSEDRAFT_67500 [Wallemia mellicola CBS 633.66]EIM23197.1 hypothetical protein WALSEDRAFT_67500 [Wallemia mellicola CBS 633.66]|eukprot:XP_006956591.1 hypothetical protein WALSEDRAFT_67500 [Wallemia mellicola CBS 633.66]
MFCLRWWLLMFLLPFPTASPIILSLFMLSYVIYQKPCPYCFVLLLCLFASTCHWGVGAPDTCCWFTNKASISQPSWELDLRKFGQQLIIDF